MLSYVKTKSVVKVPSSVSLKTVPYSKGKPPAVVPYKLPSDPWISAASGLPSSASPLKR